MASADDIRAAVRRYLDTVATGTATEIAALYAEDATVEDPAGTPAHVGRAAIEKFYSALESTRRSTELLTVRVAGDSAAFAFRVVTETGDQRITIDPIDVMTFDEQARITSMRAYWSPDDITMG
ncbi:nuclear transport factor 2 family protein [Nocardia farcinica]|uniref:nuclear transport factor 2 family protein n=1 Tax=Nocardia farcinica TaxID=37329 RepID=UPI00189428F4|nr:nuclear transport factor 2 family protein [Nocardia farcinica]MBF6140232.1 nuclear transport factor 2 family protein [Nocardia farcinica]MBF6375308.1 nuclear transport factor 2 family protein [Nocardia farcinica]